MKINGEKDNSPSPTTCRGAADAGAAGAAVQQALLRGGRGWRLGIC